MDWNDDVISRLRALWDEGHSTAEIGRRLGVTKNAVVGKAHRLALPPRPSPIRRSEVTGHVPRREMARRTTGPTLPVMADAPRSVPPPRAMLHTVPAQPTRAPASTCCWPIGDPGTPSFRFCDGGALTNKPYCAEHAALAYVKVRDRRDDAA